MTGRRFALGALALLSTAGCFHVGRRTSTPPRTRATGISIPPDSIPPIVVDSITSRPAGTPAESVFVANTAPPQAAEKAAERCLLDVDGDRSQFIKDPISEKYTSYFGGGVVGHCREQDITITADSAEFYDQNQLYYLLGNVKYREKRVNLDADKLTYFRAEERLLAEGNVVVVMSDSSTMTGPRAEYFRAVRGVRPRQRIVATMRPTLKLYEADSIGTRRGEPVILVADQINGEGDSLFVAWGKVELDRTDILARGDSAILDNARQFSRLMKQPYVESKGNDKFTLRGREIDMFARNKQVERVLSKDSAVAVNQDLTLASDTIDLRVKGNQLQRAYAFGPGAASAVSKERTIIADSLDVRMPGQKLREMYAVRNAYAETDPDSTKIKSTERDWLRGDTIVARFDSIPAADTSTRPRIRDLLASGSASSFYQVANNKGEDRPGMNYVRGREIVVDFSSQVVQTVTVVDSAAGIFLEAVPDSVANLPTKPPRGKPGKASTKKRPSTAVKRPPNAPRRP
ncbi:MAG: LptA/OstA family protein [Gemmatimonadota bacterium]